ncbi:uncharacterized protein N7477_003983 [Penicillium maclennaniae]|uniref:uncharacterized protein n=1 Tax=Penicillium maclennaniae TaxID=1343394 RepID=UPI0025401809|nr:uncharacterized protein N7477_003983 [Penicillium maclennaniae]KAJ5678350.1 hypothetical protein N7477_003983 [Penicillium maclennaniae]
MSKGQSDWCTWCLGLSQSCDVSLKRRDRREREQSAVRKRRDWREKKQSASREKQNGDSNQHPVPPPRSLL